MGTIDVLIYNNEYKAVLGMFIPSRLHMMLKGKSEDYRKRNDVQPHLEAVYTHESMHYFQTSMTGNGQTSWIFYRQAMAFVLEEWKSHTHQNKHTKLIPLGYYTEKYKSELASMFFLQTSTKEFLLQQQIHNYCHQSLKKLDDLGSMLLKGDFDINPIIKLKNEEYPLNGIDIIESHAKFIESVYSMIINKIPMEKTIDENKIPKQYYYALHWFIQEVGNERLNEFPIICDLAFQTIWKPEIKSFFDWKHIHPSWRFVILTIALKDGIVPILKSSKEVINTYNDYCDTLLKYCKFPILSEVFKSSIDRYDSRELLGLEKMMRDSIDFRMKYPWCGANPLLDFGIWVQMKKDFGPTLLQTDDGLEFLLYSDEKLPVNNSMPPMMLENIAELHLQAFSCQLLNYTSRYSSDVNELQCGLGYFGLKNGCPYQRSPHNCKASFLPSEGFPIQMQLINNQAIGCSFEMFLTAADIDINDIEVNFKYNLPKNL